MPNGEVVIARLDAIEESLIRALKSVESEKQQRRVNDTYTQPYLHDLTSLVEQASRMEDKLKQDLAYG